MAKWLRFEQNGRRGFGTLSDGRITVHDGDMFFAGAPTGETASVADVTLLTPCDPSKMLCLWHRNIGARGNAFDQAVPATPSAA